MSGMLTYSVYSCGRSKAGNTFKDVHPEWKVQVIDHFSEWLRRCFSISLYHAFGIRLTYPSEYRRDHDAMALDVLNPLDNLLEMDPEAEEVKQTALKPSLAEPRAAIRSGVASKAPKRVKKADGEAHSATSASMAPSGSTPALPTSPPDQGDAHSSLSFTFDSATSTTDSSSFNFDQGDVCPSSSFTFNSAASTTDRSGSSSLNFDQGGTRPSSYDSATSTAYHNGSSSFNFDQGDARPSSYGSAAFTAHHDGSSSFIFDQGGVHPSSYDSTTSTAYHDSSPSFNFDQVSVRPSSYDSAASTAYHDSSSSFNFDQGSTRPSPCDSATSSADHTADEGGSSSLHVSSYRFPLLSSFSHTHTQNEDTGGDNIPSSTVPILSTYTLSPPSGAWFACPSSPLDEHAWPGMAMEGDEIGGKLDNGPPEPMILPIGMGARAIDFDFKDCNTAGSRGVEAGERWGAQTKADDAAGTWSNRGASVHTPPRVATSATQVLAPRALAQPARTLAPWRKHRLHLHLPAMFLSWGRCCLRLRDLFCDLFLG
ncbi:hypothetical protein B0H17DRAFT_1212085 [Mycena rosella]|uniref:Uncharacterized protein n=1 Tax=Mycena rosella TaxID=1033263 RepID=A0AAD7G5M0_MYCRO|nr:hypothetical protein B0H17DRAFT_1212085 [Mycena rosella]